MKWQKEPPTVAGFYWLKRRNAYVPTIAHVLLKGGVRVRVATFDEEGYGNPPDGAEWSGPIPEPEEGEG